MVAAGQADCLRIDHPDGLADPRAYFERLQAAVAAVRPDAAGDGNGRVIYLAIEKILAGHERLPERWPVHGTTGYRFMNVVNGLFVDRAARARFDRVYAAFIGEHFDFDEVLHRSKVLVALHSLASDVNSLAARLTRIAKRNRHTCDYTGSSIRRALIEVCACFPVYRTYADAAGASGDDRRHWSWALAQAQKRTPAAETSVYAFIGAALDGSLTREEPALADAILRFVLRFQQLTAPIMAKGMEDTSFYVYNRLVSLNEVGGDPRTFGFTVAAFHGATADRTRHWPHTMLATATHDSKRGEDVRTRIDVLSEMPAVWRLALRRWRQANRRHRSMVDRREAPSRNDEYLLYQTLLGAWPLGPLDDAGLESFRERIHAYMQKAVREAKVHTSWLNPDTAYEAALARFIDGALAGGEDNRFVQDLRPLADRLARHGCVNSLAQTLVKLTAPGVPDIYQGCELWSLALVDPDNRRAVDYAQRRRWLDDLQRDPRSPDARAAALLAEWPDGRVKLWLIARLLALRRERAAWFERAGYRPLRVEGTHARRALAYARHGDGRSMVVVVPRLWLPLASEEQPWPLGAAWGDTMLRLASDAPQWRNLLTDAALVRGPGATPRLALRDVLATFPVAALEPC
jgi:(1->4)-alpha-D-glucan 1-alpha-D-glucosylmutase